MTPTAAVLSPAQLAERLPLELPHWYLEGGTLRRRFRTGGWKGALMVVNTVGHLAEAAWHHPELSVSYAAVVVELTTHSDGGITEKDLVLARKIEEVVSWQPALEAGGALDGTPNDDARFRYIDYDPLPVPVVSP